MREHQIEDCINGMLAALQTQYGDKDQSPDQSAAVVLLDFAKAYDSLERDYLAEILRRYGFGQCTIRLTHALHDNTELSNPIPITRGIRQGCPLAPLIFLIGVEALPIAIKQETAKEGLVLGGSEARQQRIFAGFVDDSTLFLRQAGQLGRCLQTLKRFEKASGLRVQPTKCQGVWLNTACGETELGGLPFLLHGQKTRYMGVQVGI